MNENEIIKALERCGSKKGIDSCFNCPLHRKKDCVSELQGHLFNLVKRQKAEIERLQKEKAKIHKFIPKMIKEAKAEAIKEFADRVKKLDVNTRILYSSVVYELGEDNIDNLVKEMTEQITKIEHNSLCETDTYTKE